jgi:hypothetical protein
MNIGAIKMTIGNRHKIWVAIRIERGFPVEVKGYRRRKFAEKQEQAWRKCINLDYDETGVLEMSITGR